MYHFRTRDDLLLAIQRHLTETWEQQLLTELGMPLEQLTSDLQADASQKLWIINAYPLVMAGLLLGAGTLGDRIGHKRMFLTGPALFTAASLLAAFAPSRPVLIAARAFLAVGAAAMLPATLSLIRITFDDDRERGIAIGVLGPHGRTRLRTGPHRRRPPASVFRHPRP